MVKQISAGRKGKQNCTLCVEEKPMIIKGRSKNVLGGGSEMFGGCRHVVWHHCFGCHLCLYARVVDLICQLPEDRQPAWGSEWQQLIFALCLYFVFTLLVMVLSTLHLHTTL